MNIKQKLAEIKFSLSTGESSIKNKINLYHNISYILIDSAHFESYKKYLFFNFFSSKSRKNPVVAEFFMMYQIVFADYLSP